MNNEQKLLHEIERFEQIREKFMGKRRINENYRVVVDVDERYLFGDDEAKNKQRLSIAQDIEAQIKRHVDGFSSVHIECDSSEVCTHCGETWEVCEEGDPEVGLKPGSPVCCEAAILEFEAENETH